MGRFLLRGCPKGPINLLSPSFFCEPGSPVRSRTPDRSCTFSSFSSSTAPQAFPRPDRGTPTPARAEAVGMARSATPQGSSFYGFEHDGTLERVGDDNVRGELQVGARSIVSHPCMRRAKGPNHDAGIRIGSKLRGGGPILRYAMRAMACIGTPPPRTVIGDPSQAVRTGAESVWCFLIAAPFSVPDVGRRPQARRYRGRSATRRWAACAPRQRSSSCARRVRSRCELGTTWQRALLWNSRKRHDSWIIALRTRALPDRASPFSRRVLRLSSGEPVRPP